MRSHLLRQAREGQLSTALQWRGAPSSPLRPRPSCRSPHRSVRRRGPEVALWLRPADPRRGRLRLPGSSPSGSFLSPFQPSSFWLRPPGLPRGRRDLGVREPRAGTRPQQPPPPTGAPSSPGMWVEVPRSDAPGIRIPGRGARGSRQVSVPDAPLNPPHHSHQSLTPPPFMAGAGGPDPNRAEAGAPGRGAGGRGPLAFALFSQQLLGAALCRHGARRRAGDGGASAAASSSRPVLRGCSWHWGVGKLEGGAPGGCGRRAEPGGCAPGAGPGALMGLLPARACVCSLRPRGPCPARSAPRASGCGSGPGIRGRRGGGGGEGRARGLSTPPRRRPAPRAPAGRTTPASRACPRRLLLLLLCRRRRRRRRSAPARPSRPARRGPGRAAAARRSGRGRCARLGPAEAEGGALRRSRGRAPRRAHAGRRAAPVLGRAVPGRAAAATARKRPEASAGPLVGAQGRPQPAGEGASPRRAWPGVRQVMGGAAAAAPALRGPFRG